MHHASTIVFGKFFVNFLLSLLTVECIEFTAPFSPCPEEDVCTAAINTEWSNMRISRASSDDIIWWCGIQDETSELENLAMKVEPAPVLAPVAAFVGSRGRSEEGGIWSHSKSFRLRLRLLLAET